MKWKRRRQSRWPVWKQRKPAVVRNGHRQNKKKLLTRLKTVEGQIRGIQKMVEADAYCPDILMQVSAVSNALNSFNKLLLASHIRGCVSDDIREGRDGKVDELCTMLQKLMK